MLLFQIITKMTKFSKLPQHRKNKQKNNTPFSAAVNQSNRPNHKNWTAGKTPGKKVCGSKVGEQTKVQSASKKGREDPELISNSLPLTSLSEPQSSYFPEKGGRRISCPSNGWEISSPRLLNFWAVIHSVACKNLENCVFSFFQPFFTAIVKPS